MNENRIVFDLEMNQGYKPFVFLYEDQPQTLRGEVIQIGAAKVDENFQVLDTFHLTLRPRVFPKLHHHVARVTGLTQSQLNRGQPVAKGLESFIRWCGPEPVLLEWGMDDVPVLKQNLAYLGMDERFPARWYDLQQMCAQQFPPAEGEKMNLEAVVERMGLLEERPFHDALSDVLYTCRVAQQLDAQAAFDNYVDHPQQLRLSLERRGPVENFTLSEGNSDREAWRGDFAHSARCPHCGGLLQPDPFWLKYASNCYYSLCSCDGCEEQRFLLMKLSHPDGLHWCFARASRLADEETLARWQKERRGAAKRLGKEKEASGAEGSEAQS